MIYPVLKANSATRDIIDKFYGYNHKLATRDGEFFETRNLTTKYYPMFANRNKRRVFNSWTDEEQQSHTFGNLQAIIAKNVLYWVDNGILYANGAKTALTGLQQEKETQLVSMGAYICIFPDKKYINTADLSDFGSMEASYENAESSQTGRVDYRMCHQDGTVYTSVTKSATEPENPADGDVWVDTADDNAAKEYSDGTWITLETVFTRIDFTTQGDIPDAFREYDGVEIDGMYCEDLNGSKILYAVGGRAGGDGVTAENDWIVLVGVSDENHMNVSARVTIKREVPEMNYVCEAQNRLWGCFYGHKAGVGTLNEIYCCALGDFRNWNQYLGVSTDSWRASRGSDGPWTGCINYLGSPTFFKENVIHPVSVSSIGAHQIGDIPARGVQKGSNKSLAVVNETLYYKSRTGVMAYQGGMPVEVSDALGDEKYYNAVAGVFGTRYYISMQDSDEHWQFFCYDASRGIWMHEDELRAKGFAQVEDELYAQGNNQIIALNGTDERGTSEPRVSWAAETGILHYEQSVRNKGAVDVRYVSRYNIRVQMAEDSELRLYVQYDSQGPWIYKGGFTMDAVSSKTGTLTIPVRPHRCDHLRMRIEGAGDVRILSVARLLEKGSDA